MAAAGIMTDAEAAPLLGGNWRPLPEPPIVEFAAACKIEDKQTGDLVPFKLWDCQLEALERMAVEERLFVLKARQLGLTWLDLLFWLHALRFHGHRAVLVMRQSFDEAADAIHRVKVLNDSLLESERSWHAEVVRDNVASLWFANDSRFEALTATQHVARGRAAYGALADEFAFWSWPAKQLAALDAACARLHGLTTGNGPGDHAHEVWKLAAEGKGRWQSLFLPWSAHPDRDAGWYRANVLEAPEPRLARREYPGCAEEAFAAPEGVFFERFDPVRNTDEVTVVRSWPTVRAVDFGYHHPAVAWIQTSPAGQPFVIAELVPSDTTTEELVSAIRVLDASLGLNVPPRLTYCDPAGNAANVQTARSEVEILRAAGLNPVSRPSSIRDGCVRLMGYLADEALPLVISRSCPWIIEAFSAVRPDKHRPDLYDEDSDYTHILDALRYWAVNQRTSPIITGPVSGGRPVTAGLAGRHF